MFYLVIIQGSSTLFIKFPTEFLQGMDISLDIEMKSCTSNVSQSFDQIRKTLRGNKYADDAELFISVL